MQSYHSSSYINYTSFKTANCLITWQGLQLYHYYRFISQAHSVDNNLVSCHSLIFSDIY